MGEAMLSRREALLGLTAGGLAIGYAAPGAAAAVEAAPLRWTPLALTAAQAQTLSAACEIIVPATDTPGAIEAGVPQFIDRAVSNWCRPEDAARMRAGLTDLDNRSRMLHNAAFAAATPQQQAALLTAVEGEAKAGMATRQPHYFNQLLDLTTAGYFTSRIGSTKALIYDPVPGEYHGSVPLAKIGRAFAL